MSRPVPDITVNPPNTILPNDGSKAGVNAGPTNPNNPPSRSIAVDPNAPQKQLQQTWRPEPFTDLHNDLGLPAMASAISRIEALSRQAAEHAAMAMSIAQGGGSGGGGAASSPDPFAMSPSRRSYATSPGGGGAGVGLPPGENNSVWSGDRAAQVSRSLDQAIKITYQTTTALQSIVAGRQVGTTSVLGSSLAVTTGLVLVTHVDGSINNGITPHNFTLSIFPSQTPGAIDIFVWMPTAAGNTTPIACTTRVTVNWTAQGSIS